MGQISTMVEKMIREGAKGREIVAAVAKAEAGDDIGSNALRLMIREFEDWWTDWPNKVSKKAALRAYQSARKNGTSKAIIREGMERYIFTKPLDRPWMHPDTFLRGERWNDQPAEVLQRSRGLDHFDAAIQEIRNARADDGYGSPLVDNQNDDFRLPSLFQRH